MFLAGGAKRKARKQMRHNPPVVAAPSIEELNETPNYTGVNLRLPSENVYVLERNFAPVHGGNIFEKINLGFLYPEALHWHILLMNVFNKFVSIGGSPSVRISR